MQVRKITEEVFNATPEVTKPQPNADVIMYWNGERTPERIMNLFSVPAMYYMMVPMAHLENVIRLLRGDNPKNKRYDYVTKAHQNKIAIAVRYDVVEA